MNQRQQQRIGELDCILIQSSTITQPTVAVILCHGFGAPGTDLVSLADEFIDADPRLAQAVYIFPAAPLEMDPGYDARAWWMIDIEKIQQLMASGQTREMRSTSPERLPACRKMIFDIIEYCQTEFDIEASKIVVGGFSQGSMLGTDVALHYPKPLGGLIVWSGALICEPDWTSNAAKQTPLKVIQTHGNIDPILPISGAQDLKKMLVAAGHDVKYEEFKGPHTIPMVGLELAAALIAEVVGEEVAK